jgi:hypothetical protein
MGNTERKKEEKKYYQKLGIIPISIDNIKRIIKTNIKNTLQSWNEGIEIEKQCFRVVSPAGIGKTQTALQICKELSEELNIDFKHILIKAPVLSRDDFLCPFPVIDNGNSKFKMLYSDFVPTEEDSYGLFIIDELSRGDSSLQQLLWAVQNECRIHTKNLPKKWFVLCLDNPEDQEYSLNTVEDAAGLRRVLHLYSEVDAQAFLNHAIKSNFHPIVIEYIQIHPDYLYDFTSQKIGMVYSNPASWERVSNILWGYDKDNGILKNLEDLTTLFSGLLNQSMTRMFINFIKDRKDISPKDVFYNYDKVRNDILDFTKKSDNIKIGQLVESFVTFLSTSKPKYTNTELKNISLFLTDIPSDIGATFLSKVNTFDTKSAEFKYITGIHVELVTKFPEYKTNFYESMINISRRVNQ